MDVPAAETMLVILGIVLAALQIIHTILGIRKDIGEDDTDESGK